MTGQRISLISGLLLSSSVVLAAPECFEQSPDYIRLGDAYYDSGNTLSTDEKKQLKTAIKSIKGKWQGRTILLTCEGDAEQSQEKFDEGDASAKISRSRNGAMTLHAVVDFEQGSDKVEYDFTSRPDSEIVSLSEQDGFTKFTEKYRQHNDDATSLIETGYEVRRKENNLTVIISRYINGYLESAQIFGLSRD